MIHTSLPKLRILPLKALILHEEHDNQRTQPLVEKLRAQGILRNPPIVMPLTDGTKRYMVLDGANRVTSLKEMEFPHIVAQVVELNDPNVLLRTWKHVVWGMSSRTLITAFRRVKGLELTKINTIRSMEPPEHAPVQVRLADGSVYIGRTPNPIASHVRVLREMVNLYKDRASLDRTSQTLIETFKSTYPDLTALMIFPRFEIQAVLDLAGNGSILPPGITRFTVSPRALHLNYPLHELSSGKPIEYKEAYLKQWVDERMTKKGIRFYAEATFLFDE